MKNLCFTKCLFLTLLFIFCSQMPSAQEERATTPDSAKAVEWVRLQNDDDGFSIELPSDYESLSESDGFTMGKASGEEIEFRNVRMITAYSDNALLRVESYKLKNPKKGLDLMVEQAKGDSKTVARDNLRGKQFTFSNEKFYSVAEFFATKTNLYVIFTASRAADNSTAQRFLSSLNFNSASAGASKTIKFLELKNSPFALTEEPNSVDKDQNQPPANPQKPDADVNSKPLTIVSQPFPGYTNAARMKNVSGMMRLRVTFSATGRVSKIGILSSLPEGLSRQAVYAALRIKFLPAEKNGEPISVTKVVEYSFRTY